MKYLKTSTPVIYRNTGGYIVQLLFLVALDTQRRYLSFLLSYNENYNELHCKVT